MTNSLPSLNMGKNLFTINTAYPDHILGSIPDTNLFQMKYNCWYNPYDSAKFNVFKYENDSLKQVSAIYLPKWCSSYLNYQTPSVVNKGNGIYDTMSWDYEDINDLLGEGEGGSISLALPSGRRVTSEEQERVEALYEFREFKQLNNKINDDPILKRMKKRYEKTMTSNKQRQEKAITTNTLNSKLDGRARQEQSEKLISRAKDNIMRSKYLSKEEKEVRRLEDMDVLFSKIKDDLQTDDVGISLPMTYNLSQNYPNPFNPTTKINYELPITNYVSLKVYDVLGKEVMKLVNDNQNAGRYSVEFNGSNLPSGVYFYRIESGEFNEVKRMVLLK